MPSNEKNLLLLAWVPTFVGMTSRRTWVGEAHAGVKLARPLHADTPGLSFLVKGN